MIGHLALTSLLLLFPGAALLAQGGALPRDLLGDSSDDYGSRHTITDSSWIHHPSIRYRIIRWDPAGRYLIARTTDAHYARIDGIRFEAMPPWSWGFCVATWTAPSADSAARVAVARRATPRTGCNGFPFTRMRRAGTDADQPPQSSRRSPHRYR